MDDRSFDTAADETELSTEQVSALEQVVKNFITGAKDANMDPLEPILTVMGHSSHLNDMAQ